VALVRHSPDAYFWLRLGFDGDRINDLRFENLVRLDDGVVHLTLAGQGSTGFVVEGSADLRQWFAIATNGPPNAGLAWRDLKATNSNQRFYRVH
jgi:hypothetical protein